MTKSKIDKQAYAASAMLAAANAQREAHAKRAVTTAAANRTLAEALHAHIESNTVPTDMDVIEAFRFDCVFTMADRRNLLTLYRHLVLDHGVSTAAIQGWIAEGKETVTARIEELFQPHRDKIPTVRSIMAEKWYRKNPHVFDHIGGSRTAEDREKDTVLQAILCGATPGERMAGGVGATREVDTQMRLVEADIMARADKGENIAYLISRPQMANEAIVFAPCNRTHDDKLPMKIKIVELTPDGMCTGVLHVAATLDEAKEYATDAYYEAERMKWEGKQAVEGKGEGKTGDGEKGKAKAKAKDGLDCIQDMVSSLKVDDVD
ncbi:hypothetical protein COL5a_001849 [Colletotrichum fioriniae]|uniref:uncharacterized protein n=1 Tax=Colletotrichum fioriniae TaxID=710243 RepID=UPI0022FFD3B5|nr:uncharacterized protein COL516b_001238 [Colletotrichum fioriniae]KAJ0312166.1 hypothetical protein COL516b_001238 [Colletotrichum fioriniae]KAJ0332145.1 hypothetical protein COL5a_001849 [Colletotrichum fioriniae]KAJ3945891.1 hypothetical protein N0V96_004239 [Colletotrichum fioriniae]